MEVKTNDLIMTQIMNCLVTEYGYGVIRFSEQRNDLWLVNKDDKTFPLVRLNPYASSSTMLEREYLDRVLEFSKNFKTEQDILVLNTNEESKPFHEAGYLQEVVTTSHIGDKVLAYFPKLKEAVHKTENVSEEMKNIEDNLRNYQQKKQKQAKRNQYNVPLVTGIIIAICVVMYCLSLLLSTKIDDWNVVLITLGAYYKAFILAGHEYWRFLTAGFLHGSLLHLVMNMIALLSVGRLIEKTYKKWQFLVILLGSTIIGNVFTFLIDGNIVGIGLSGGIYGLLAALLLYMYETGAMKIPAVRNSVLQTVIINALISIMPNIGLLAHVGGFVGGLGFGLLFLKTERWAHYKKHFAICFTILLVFLGYQTMKVDSFSPVYGGTDRMVLDNYRKVGLDGYANYIEHRLYQYYK